MSDLPHPSSFLENVVPASDLGAASIFGLNALARMSEHAELNEQGECLTHAFEALQDHYLRLFPDRWADMQERALSHLAAGAMESAVLALMPATAVYTGGRLADGSVVAQVILTPGAGAHSKEARYLPMAWLAALLRSMALHLGNETA